jgi:histone H3/H4
MESITRPSINRLARRAGVKSVSDDCFDVIKNIMSEKLKDVINASIIVNLENQTKTLMADDVYEALHLCGYNITSSTNI